MLVPDRFASFLKIDGFEQASSVRFSAALSPSLPPLHDILLERRVVRLMLVPVEGCHAGCCDRPMFRTTLLLPSAFIAHV